MNRRETGESGQSMIETVIVLPVILLLFLGLYYFKEIVNTRMRAVEAARFVTWEAVWNARERRAPDRAIKDDDTLRQELVAMGLGRGLVSVQGTRDGRRTLGDYASSIPNGLPMFIDVPQFVGTFFQSPELAATDSSQSSPGSQQLPDQNNFMGPFQSVLNVVGDVTFGASDIVAKMTLWESEANGSVFRSFVTYRVRGTSVFRFLGDTDISQTSTILGHPYNVLRESNQDEYNRVFGTGEILSCTDAATRGHIFDLWFLPTIPVTGLAEVTTVGKCFVSEIGNFIGAADGVPILGGNLGFKMPDGTLKEYPELHP